MTDLREFGYRRRVAETLLWRWNPQDGWFSLARPDGGEGGVHIRLREQDGRLVISEMYVHGAEITPALLRSIPLRALEALADEAWRAKTKRDERGMVPAVATYALSADATADPTLEDLRGRRPGRKAAPAKPRPPLTRPDPSGDLDQFYRRVADAYREFAKLSRAPAAAMANEAGVPVTTVHRWVREARRRGHLPPGRKGRAG